MILNMIVSHPKVNGWLCTSKLDVLYNPIFVNVVSVSVLNVYVWGTHRSAELQPPKQTQSSQYIVNMGESEVAIRTRLFDNHQTAMRFSTALFLASPWHLRRHRNKLRRSTVEWQIQ